MKKNSVLLSLLFGAGVVFWTAQRREHQRLVTEVLIDAPPERIWQILTDTSAYSEWNPVLVSLEGQLQVGRTIEVENRGSSGSMTFTPTVLAVHPSRELRWLGHLWRPGLFDGEHFFVLTPQPGDRTLMTHGETFSGLLVPLVKRWLHTGVKQDFLRINEALKNRAEAEH